MKRLLAFVTAVAIAASLSACGGGSSAGGAASSAAGGSSAPSPAGAASQSGGNAEFPVSIGYSTTEETAQGQAAIAIKKYMEEKSNGRIAVSIYPNSQIGTDQEMLEAVQGGSLTIQVSNNGQQVSFVKDAEIFDIPYSFKSIDAINKTIENEEFIKALDTQYQKYGMNVLMVTQTGFRLLTANKPIRTPADLKGFKIRTQPDTVQIATWKTLGASPTPLAFNETYTGLQQHTVDGQENPLEFIVSQKFYEQQKYIIRDNHIASDAIWVINSEFYQSLPDEIKTIVDQAMEEGRKTADEYEKTATEKQEATVKGYGCQFIELTDDQWKQFHDGSVDIWKTVAKDVDPAVMKAFVATLEPGIVPEGIS